MAYKLTIELSERDLRHFQRELRRSRESVRIADDEDIISAARDQLREFTGVELPDFVAERLARIQLLVEMLEDRDWKLSEARRAPVLAGLAYFCDPEDIIPDSVPGIGLLDDAVMIELVFRELRHEIEAYGDFVAYRQDLVQRQGDTRNPTSIGQRLVRKREQLHARMQRRRRADLKARRGGSAIPTPLL